MSVQLYVDALDQYIYYFEQMAEAVSKVVNLLLQRESRLMLLARLFSEIARSGHAQIRQQSGRIDH